MTPEKRKSLLRYAVAADLVVLATAGGLVAGDSTATLLPLFIVAVLVTSALAGWRSGVVATIFSAAAQLLFFREIVTLPRVAIFCVAGFGICKLTEALRRARQERLADDEITPAPPPAAESALARRELRFAVTDYYRNAQQAVEEFLAVEREELHRALEARIQHERELARKLLRTELEKEKRLAEADLARRPGRDGDDDRPGAAGGGSTSEHGTPAARKLSPALAVITLGVLVPLCIIVMYTNISDLLMRRYAVPSLLQILMAVLLFEMWRLRKLLKPSFVLLHPLTILLALYCTILVVSTIWVADRDYADLRLAIALKMLVLYLIAATFIVSWGSLRRAMAAVVLAAAFLSSLTIFQNASGRFDLDFLGLARIDQGHIFGEVARPRAAGPVGDPNFFGQVLLLAVPLAVFLAATTEKRLHRVVYGGLGLLTAAGTLLTYSRGAMLALGVIVVLGAVAMKVRPLHLAAAAAISIALLLALPANFGDRIITIEEVLMADDGIIQDSSIEKRKLLGRGAIQMFLDHPWFGVGIANYGYYFPAYANIVGSTAMLYDDPGEKQQPHSLYLELAAENGFAGLVLFGAAMVAALASLYRSRRSLETYGPRSAAPMAMAVALAVISYLLTSIFLHGYFMRYLWLILAFVPAISRLAGENDLARSLREVRA